MKLSVSSELSKLNVQNVFLYAVTFSITGTPVHTDFLSYLYDTPITKSQKHIHRKVAEIPVFWVTGNRSEKLCIISFCKGVFSLLFSS